MIAINIMLLFSSCFEWVYRASWTISLAYGKNLSIIMDKFIHKAKSRGSSESYNFQWWNVWTIHQILIVSSYAILKDIKRFNRLHPYTKCIHYISLQQCI